LKQLAVEEAGMVGGQPFAVNRSRRGLTRDELAASGRPCQRNIDMYVS